MIDLENAHVLVLGSNSMLGRAIVKVLELQNYRIWEHTHEQADLTDYKKTDELIGYFCRKYQPRPSTFIIHCGGFNGNISFNSVYPAEIYSRTARMALNVLELAAKYKIDKVVSLVSSCSYPHHLEILREEDFLKGEPHPTVEAHGYAKRILFEYSRQLYKQFGLVSVCAILNTCFGPHDSYDLNKTKVVGSLIKKIVDAKNNGDTEVVLWGSGSPRRELIYSEDAANLVVNTLKYYGDVTLPINLGIGWDISIAKLAQLISNIVKYEGRIVWDVSRADGQMKKLLDVSRMHKLLPPYPFQALWDSLYNTIEWYKKKC